MAHWIIEFLGNDEICYTCSECRETFSNNYRDVSIEDVCPECGSPINEDSTEHIEIKKKVTNVPIIPKLYLGKFMIKTDVTENLRKLEEKEHRLLQVSGFDVEKLIELFAAGYELYPPKYDCVLTLEQQSNPIEYVTAEPEPPSCSGCKHFIDDGGYYDDDLEDYFDDIRCAKCHYDKIGYGNDACEDFEERDY